jgi:hypothetical protein
VNGACGREINQDLGRRGGSTAVCAQDSQGTAAGVALIGRVAMGKSSERNQRKERREATVGPSMKMWRSFFSLGLCTWHARKEDDVDAPSSGGR